MSGINYDPPEFGPLYVGCRVDHSKEVEAIKAKVYLEGFRAAREAAVRECDRLCPLVRADQVNVVAALAVEISAIPDPQPGTAGDEKETT